MSEHEFDLVVLGTGPAASTVARAANDDGRRVAVVEAREFGGTCALRGCNPKKAYTNAAALVDQARRADGQLARFGDIQIEWSDLLRFKQTFTEPVVEKSERSLQDAGIETFHGRGSFAGPNTITVGDHRLAAERVLVATGARAIPLELPGAEHVLSSDAFLELDSMPDHVVFLGGGYISLEFAHVVARAGAKVVILEQTDRVLSPFDPDLVRQLVSWSAGHGVEVRTGAEVTRVEAPSPGTLQVTYQQQGQEQTIATRLVIHGAGREPNLEGLNLEAGNIHFNRRGIEVDAHLRSVSNPAVFAAGDCAATDAPPLTPSASEEGRIAAKNLFADPPEHTPDYGAVPSVAFTVPPLAAVGKTEKQARDASDDFSVRHEDISDWNSVRKSGHDCAGYKILVDNQSDKILGAHLLGPAAEESINLFALAMKYGLTASQVKATLFTFPTFAADIRQML